MTHEQIIRTALGVMQNNYPDDVDMLELLQEALENKDIAFLSMLLRTAYGVRFMEEEHYTYNDVFNTLNGIGAFVDRPKDERVSLVTLDERTNLNILAQILVIESVDEVTIFKLDTPIADIFREFVRTLLMDENRAIQDRLEYYLNKLEGIYTEYALELTEIGFKQSKEAYASVYNRYANKGLNIEKLQKILEIVSDEPLENTSTAI